MKLKAEGKLKKIALPMLGLIIFIGLWILLSKVLGELRVPNPFYCIRLMFETVNECKLIDFQGAGKAGFLPHVVCTLQRYLINTSVGILLMPNMAASSFSYFDLFLRSCAMSLLRVWIWELRSESVWRRRESWFWRVWRSSWGRD